MNNKIFIISTGAGFFPSTVVSGLWQYARNEVWLPSLKLTASSPLKIGKGPPKELSYSNQCASCLFQGVYYLGAFFSLKRNPASFLGGLQVDCNAFFVTLFLIGKTNQILRVYVCFSGHCHRAIGVSSGKLAHHQLKGARNLVHLLVVGLNHPSDKISSTRLGSWDPKALGVKITQQKI